MLDCIIIGGGPAGLSAALNLAQRGKEALVLQAGESLLEKAAQVDNYLGMPAVSGREMLERFRAHATALGAQVRSGKAGNVMPFDGRFMVNVDGDILESKTIILAAGVSKANPVPGETALLGRGVSYCATCDGMLYRKQAVAVWGLAPDAAHEANFLAEIGCAVTFIAAKQPENLASAIVFMQGRIAAILGEETGVVRAVRVGDTEIPVTGVFILRNATPPDVLLPGLATHGGGVVVDTRGASSIAGVFAAGDVTGKPLQISKAVGEGLVAALSVVEYLDLHKEAKA